MAFTTNARIATFGGRLLKLTHQSTATATPMNLGLFLPPAATRGARPVPVLVYLSGLTCTPDNAAEKGFLHAAAARLGLAVVFPDTSPRGTDLPGEHDAWDLGSAASFYLDAAADPWRAHYRMETYLTAELPPLLAAAFPELDLARLAVAGHSMGGHGALTLALRHPAMFRSVSAFAPVANPSRCPWGQKAFAAYLGPDRDLWAAHDATELLRARAGAPFDCLIDVGTADDFYKQGQLLPENFQRAAEESGVSGVEVRYQEDYDHSYYFISTFAEDHVRHAAKALGLL